MRLPAPRSSTRVHFRRRRRGAHEHKGRWPLNIAEGHYPAVVLTRTPAASGSGIKSEYTTRNECTLGESFDIAEGRSWPSTAAGRYLGLSRCGQLLTDADAAGLLDWARRFEKIELLKNTSASPSTSPRGAHDKTRRLVAAWGCPAVGNS